MTIIQVRERTTRAEHCYIVEYANGRCRKFYEPTKAIAEFCSTRECTTYTKGYLKVHIWE